MDNDNRQSIYLRDRTRLTPAQRRRVQKHAHMETAPLSRSLRRHARRDVLKAETQRRWAIRTMFSRRSAPQVDLVSRRSKGEADGTVRAA